ncbi:MAG TPA: hypothetical protein VHU23_13865 [Rhizomicrobium sp.]|jgi:hypothetical protein|nr:hypothetical protein [Rhizomicrobium sp.]
MKAVICSIAVSLCLAAPVLAKDKPAWRGLAANAQHTAKAPTAGQSLSNIHWSMSIDHAPPVAPHRRVGGVGELLIHYASPMITAQNTVLVPVKTTSQGNFEIDAVAGASGKSAWSMKTDYIMPPYDWAPPLPVHLTGQNRLYVAGAGGTVYFRDTPDSTSGKTGQYAFYGMSKYKKNKSIYNNDVMIDTPITADSKGNIFFGFVVLASNPAKLESGIARIDSSGKGMWVSAQSAGQDQNISQVAMNCAPAISVDGSTIYITVSNGYNGYLVGLDATTLKPKYKTQLMDPATDSAALIDDDSSASPTIGPDGEVFYGVLEADGEHNCRGWLLGFSSDLATEKTPGSFGWDDTVSIVPKSALPKKSGKSSYYLMSKYNNYYECGSGNGQNKVAILDPNATQKDAYSNVTVMKEVETVLDPHQVQGEGGAVYEWCVNTAVVDSKNKSVIVNAEDGYSYRWDLTTNSLSQMLSLNQPTFEAYTPTLMGADGTLFAVNNATLYAIGN